MVTLGANGDVPNESKIRRGGHLFKLLLAVLWLGLACMVVTRRSGDTIYLHFRVVWRNSKPHQAKRNGQGLIHVDLGVLDFRHDPVGCVKAGWSGTDDGYPERPAIVTSSVRRGQGPDCDGVGG